MRAQLIGLSCILGALALAPSARAQGARAQDVRSADLLAPLAEGRGRVFAAGPRGEVPMKTDHGRMLRLADGEVVQVIEADSAGVGSGAVSRATVVARGERGTIPARHLITEQRLSRSPDGRFAVLAMTDQCGDFCHDEIWLLSRQQRHRLTGDAGPDHTVAWRRDGRQVAIGSRELYLVSLPELKVKTLAGFVSPAYAPSQQLFVRGSGSDHDDAAYELLPSGVPRRVLQVAGAPPQPEPEADVPPPAPVTFDAAGTSVMAQFERGRTTIVRSARIR
ncbi:MAG TPA: hypothetical protein VGQ83_16495 [Polyangia bacterium]